MDKNKYAEYLLRNAYRLEEELLKSQEERELCLIDFLNKAEHLDLAKDVAKTIKFYKNLNIVYREAMILRYIKSYLIKEVAGKTHFSQSRLKAIFKKCKTELIELLEEENYDRKN